MNNIIFFRKNKLQKIISKILIIWMILIITILLSLSRYSTYKDKFYNFGPNNELIIIGFHINTNSKYYIVIIYCFVNSMFRTLYNSILHSWLINNVQNENIDKPKEIVKMAYEITTVTTIYMWFDWFIYINILLSQIDMILIEILADLIISILTTRYYLQLTNIRSEIEILKNDIDL